jgi:hypothetical protein
MVAQKAKFEPPHTRGSIQSTCYAWRFFGHVVAAPIATYLYDTRGPYPVILLTAIYPLLALPLIFVMHEDKNAKTQSAWEQCTEIWNTVQMRAVWQPMAFVYLFSLLHMHNAAWRQFLVTVLDFTTCQLNILLIAAYGFLYLGIMTYKFCMIGWSWRWVYILTICINAILSFLQLCLVYDMTFGIPAFFFALGDDVMLEFNHGLHAVSKWSA